MDPMGHYKLAQDGLDEMLASVPADGWNAPSACPDWTIRDVAGHVIWGQEQMRHWATGEEYAVRTGAPGMPNPGEMAGDDPVATWRAARAESVPALTQDALQRMIGLPGLGEIPLAAMVVTFMTDQLVHTWDIGHGLGLDVRLDPELIPVTSSWARDHVRRAPGFFGPELTPPPGADEQTRLLAFLGRAPWTPVTA